MKGKKLDPAEHPELRVARRVARYTRMLYETLRDPELAPTARAEALAEVQHIAAVIDPDVVSGPDGKPQKVPPMHAMLDEIEGARLTTKYVDKTIEESADDAIEGLHLRIGPADAQAIVRAPFRAAVAMWPGRDAKKSDALFKLLERAIARTSFARRWESIRSDVSDWRTPRKRPGPNDPSRQSTKR